MNSICKQHPITPGQATQEVQLNLQLANLEDPDGGIFLTPRKPRWVYVIYVYNYILWYIPIGISMVNNG